MSNGSKIQCNLKIVVRISYMFYDHRTIFDNMTETDFDSSRYFVIVLTVMEENPYDTINRILGECWKYHIANLVILVPTHSYKRILLYTYFPYTDDHCEQVKPILRNYFENNSFFDLRVPPFPDKCGNFHQCPLYVAATNDEPYTFLTGYGTNETPQFSGLDAMVVGEISKRLNFKMEVLPYDGGFYYDDVIVLLVMFGLYLCGLRPSSTNFEFLRTNSSFVFSNTIKLTYRLLVQILCENTIGKIRFHTSTILSCI